MRIPRLLVAAAAAIAVVAGGVVPAGAATSPAAVAQVAGPNRFLGVFQTGQPGTVPAEVKARYGATPASVMWFDSWGTGAKFPVADAKKLWRQGVMPHYTWEPWYTDLGPNDPGQIKLADIVDGTWDSYIKARGREFARVGKPIMVRWAHEFNGNWYPWGIANNGADPSLYVRAYQHVHDLVEGVGADNVQWVWAYNNGSSPNEAYNDPAAAYPGDDYVDWVGIDGYNWGFGPSWDPGVDHWVSFEDTFAGAYATSRVVAPGKPVMLGEFASSADGGDKARWIADMNATLRAGTFPDLRLLTYFDVVKEEAWSPGSSPEATDAFIDWVSRWPMKGTGAGLARIAR